jgi:hypothetical protein
LQGIAGDHGPSSPIAFTGPGTRLTVSLPFHARENPRGERGFNRNCEGSLLPMNWASELGQHTG